MGIKKYILASILLLIVITGYVFSVESGDYRMQIVDQFIILPVAVWIMVPALILFVVTLLHMFFYGFKNYLSSRAIQKDNENLLIVIKQRLINQTASVTFKSDEVKELGNILSQVDLTISGDEFTSSDKKISKTSEYILDINNKKYVSNKDFKLSNDNVLMQQNLKNRVDSDDNFALDVLKQPSLYKNDLIKCAFIKVIDTKSMTSIKKVLDGLTLDVEMLIKFVSKDSQEKTEFSLDNRALLKLINSVDISNKDLITIAKAYKLSMNPEQLIKLYEDLMTQNEKLTESYLYVLSEYEMIDDIREILVNSQKNEFTIYKAYLDLRDAGKHYSINSFLVD